MTIHVMGGGMINPSDPSEGKIEIIIIPLPTDHVEPLLRHILDAANQYLVKNELVKGKCVQTEKLFESETPTVVERSVADLGNGSKNLH